MKVKVDDSWGQITLLSEDGQKMKVTGQMVEYNGHVGRIWLVTDTQAACGGHGVGQILGCQAVICTKDMRVIPVKYQWQKVFDITLLGNYSE